jgi:hypothetical protein
VVRGPAAVLALYGATAAYFVLADELPYLGDSDAQAILSGAVGLTLLAACALALLPIRDLPLAMVPIAAGGGLLAAGLSIDTVDFGPGANVPKVLFAASLGMLLAWWLASPTLLIAVPLFVAGIDIASVVAGPTSKLIEEQPKAVDFLTFELPLWGGGGFGQLGISDMVFLSFFAAGAWRFGLRRRATAAGLVLALLATLVAGVLLDEALPVLPALALGLLVPNLDRLGPMLAAERRGAEGRG